jgi:hypothetical protein
METLTNYLKLWYAAVEIYLKLWYAAVEIYLKFWYAAVEIHSICELQNIQNKKQ